MSGGVSLVGHTSLLGEVMVRCWGWGRLHKPYILSRMHHCGSPVWPAEALDGTGGGMAELFPCVPSL